MRPRLPLIMLILSILLLSGQSAFSLDPSISFPQYARRSWQIEHGLPQNIIRTIAQTPDGYIWIGTPSGIARFDGVTFTVFDESNTPALRGSDEIRGMVVDGAGDLWVTTFGGIVRWHGGTFERQLTGPDFGSAATGRDGTLVFGSSGSGLLFHRNGRFTKRNLSPEVPVNRSIANIIDNRGTVWFGTVDAGLGRIEEGAIRIDRSAMFSNLVSALFCDKRGDVWIGSDLGVARYHDGMMTTYTAADGIDGVVSSFADDADGNLWIGTFAGLLRFRDGRFTKFTTADGLIDNIVSALAIDRQGNLWVGTASGLMQFREAPFRVYGQRDLKLTESISAVLRDRDGAIWVGAVDGVARMFRGRVTVYGKADGISEAAVVAMAEGHDGAVWIGTSNGVYRIRDGVVTPFTTAEGLSGTAISGIETHPNGDVWVATKGGALNRIRDGRIAHFGLANGLGSTRIYGMHAARDGSLLFDNSSGLMRLRGDRATVLIPPGLNRQIVNTIHEEPNGVLWLAIFGRGLLRWHHGKVTAIGKAEGLHDSGIRGMVDDGRGSFWLTCGKGLMRVSKQQLEALARGRIKKVDSTVFGLSDGLRTLQMAAGPTAGAVDGDGVMYFATGRGLAVIDPATVRRNPIAPPVFVERVEVDFVNLQPGIHVAPPGTRRLEFSYTALSYDAPDSLRFRFRLEGVDRDWIDAGPRRVAQYTNINPGHYRFRVIAANKDGIWNTSGASFDLDVRPYFYETVWFQVGILGALLAAAAASVRIRIRMLQRDKQMILNAAGDGIIATTATGVIVLANPSAARLLGWSVAELLTSNIHSIIHTPEEAEVEIAACSVCSARRDLPPPCDRTGSFITRDGTIIPVEYKSSRIVTRSGRITGVVVTFRDISERLSIQRMKDEFISTVSHELRTPMTAIGAALGLLHSGSLVAEKRDRLVKIALTNSERLGRLINEILDVERMSSGREVFHSTRFDAADVIEETIDSLRSIAERDRIVLVAETDHILLSADRDKIVQTLTNLIGNAIKFSPPGMTVRVGVEATAEQTITFFVADQGRGIPAEKIDRIFERFEQVYVTDARAKGGTGLGLAICRAIVDAHGGRIWAESQQGTGSTFRFALPLVSIVPEGDSEAAAPETHVA